MIQNGAGSAPAPAGLLAAIEAVLDFLPLHYVPPRRQIIRPAILILQVVRVLPDVHAEHRELAFHHRTVLVPLGDDVALAAALPEPRPARPEARGARLIHLLLESVDAA